LKEAKVPARALAGIGVGCPGVLDLDDGVILEAPNLGWKRVPLRALLTGWFHCRVVLANDVDAGTYGEYRFGAGKGARTLVGVFPGTGIGGGCVYDGQAAAGQDGVGDGDRPPSDPRARAAVRLRAAGLPRGAGRAAGDFGGGGAGGVPRRGAVRRGERRARI
jgi:predicted NBD/HSP70 family sugar kinase